MKVPSALKDIMIFVLIFGGVLYGLPKAFSLILKSPYPMAAVSSNSMWPVLERGDLILVKGVEKDDIKIDDIVVYRVEDGFVIHRVIELKDKTLITKGDANQNPDLPVAYEKVIGKTVNISEKPFSVPYLGNITAFANPTQK